jgi:hypothetical protein
MTSRSWQGTDTRVPLANSTSNCVAAAVIAIDRKLIAELAADDARARGEPVRVGLVGASAADGSSRDRRMSLRCQR